MASLSSTLGLRAGEGPRTTRLVAFVFLVTAAAVLARSAQREIFLAAYPRNAISDAFLYAAAALMGASLGLSALAARFSVLRLTQGLVVAAAVLFCGARVATGVAPQGSAMAVYLVVEVLVSLLLTQGWAVVTEAVDVRSAKRLLPLVGIGAGLAWTVGGLAVGALARRTGPGLILALSPVALLGALWVLSRIRRSDVSTESVTERQSEGLWRGLRRVGQEPLLRVVALIVAVEAMVEKVTDLQLLAMAQAKLAAEAGAISAFMGLFYAVTGAVTLITPVVSGRVLSRFGSTRALMVGQLWVVGASLLLVVVPQLAVVVLLSGGDRILKQALGSSARAQVLGALPSTQRSQAGAVLRGVVASGASASAAVGLKLVPASLPVEQLAWVSMGLMGVLAVVTWRWLRESYVLALRHSLDQSRLDLDGVSEVVALDREQLATYADELVHADATRASLAVSLLGTAPMAQTRPLLAKALEHPAAEVRAQAVTVLGRRGNVSDAGLIRSVLEASGRGRTRAGALSGVVDERLVVSNTRASGPGDAGAEHSDVVRVSELRGAAVERSDASRESGRGDAGAEHSDVARVSELRGAAVERSDASRESGRGDAGAEHSDVARVSELRGVAVEHSDASRESGRGDASAERSDAARARELRGVAVEHSDASRESGRGDASAASQVRGRRPGVDRRGGGEPERSRASEDDGIDAEPSDVSRQARRDPVDVTDAGVAPLAGACREAVAALKATDALGAMEPFTTAESPRVRALARACRMRLLELRGEAFGADW
ncbi:MAG: hypothetical protein JNG84_06425, partial [Archangium sp.]|nr:hypothetical protein [Archangium sp.]